MANSSATPEQQPEASIPYGNIDSNPRFKDYHEHTQVLWDDFVEEDPTSIKATIFNGLFGDLQNYNHRILDPYFSYDVLECCNQYQNTPSYFLPLGTHAELLEMIHLLYECRNKTRAEIRGELEKLDAFRGQDDSEKNFSILFCLRVWLMTNIRQPNDSW